MLMILLPTFCLYISVIPLCCLVSADLFSESYYSAHNQASIILIIMYIFSRLTYILDKLLENYFDALVVDQKMTNIHTFIEVFKVNYNLSLIVYRIFPFSEITNKYTIRCTRLSSDHQCKRYCHTLYMNHLLLLNDFEY